MNLTDLFTWDYADRMTRATVSGTTTTYAYDGDHVRTSATTSGTTTNYLWDRTPALPVMVSDGTTAYVHADGIQQEIDALGNPRYHLTDALGSVRGVYDLSGTQAASTEYDVFGDVRASSGTSSLFAYTGEQHDPTTGFTHLRARDYDPATGRFTARDTVQPNADGTQGFSRYCYVSNNPCSATDPSGHVQIPEPPPFPPPFPDPMNFDPRNPCDPETIIAVAIAFAVILGTLKEGMFRQMHPIFWSQIAAVMNAVALLMAYVLIGYIVICLAMVAIQHLIGPDGGAAGPNEESPDDSGGLQNAPSQYPRPPTVDL